MTTRTLLVAVVALALCSPGFAAQPLAVTFHSYTTSQDFTAAGAVFEGTRLTKQGDAITYGSSVGTYAYTDPYGAGTRTYSYSRSTSPWFATRIDFTALHSSRNADTPATTWTQVERQA